MLTRYLVGYDIADARRLRIIHEVCQGYGTRIQYSLFLCDLSDRGRIELERDLTGAMHRIEDRIMIVRLGRTESRGAQAFTFFGDGQRPPDKPDIVIV